VASVFSVSRLLLNVFLHIKIFCTAFKKSCKNARNYRIWVLKIPLDVQKEKHRKTEKSGSLSTLISPLHVIFSEVSDFSGLL
jgi:hypothetical protein